MLVLAEKMLIWSMKLEKSRWKGGRLAGRILGIFPVYYSCWLEKRLFKGSWNPGGRLRRRRKRRPR